MSHLSQTGEIKIVNTTKDDFHKVVKFFEQAMEMQGKNGYKVWSEFDKERLQKDIDSNLQYKIIAGANILCIFSIQLQDPLIWRERDNDDAIYLHRIVVNPEFKGQKQFEKVLNWAKAFARQNNLCFVRMDTWADNKQIIDYYKTFGFEVIEYYTTPNTTALPIQNRNLDVALLQTNAF